MGEDEAGHGLVALQEEVEEESGLLTVQLPEGGEGKKEISTKVTSNALKHNHPLSLSPPLPPSLPP